MLEAWNINSAFTLGSKRNVPVTAGLASENLKNKPQHVAKAADIQKRLCHKLFTSLLSAVVLKNYRFTVFAFAVP